MRLSGKVALITGAGSGFGAAMAVSFAREGARVIVQDLKGEAAEGVANGINLDHPDHAVAIAGDVTRREAIADALDLAAERFGGIDILVNNAGYTHRNGPMLEVDEATFDRVYAVNVKAIYLAALEAVPRLQARGGGVILNTASTAALRPRPGLTWYNGSKAAAVVLSKSMAVELAPLNIRVNALCPVMGATGMLEDFMGGADSPEMRAKFTSTIPLGRLSTPQDIANAALYLASDEAGFITGVALEVDGGRCV